MASVVLLEGTEMFASAHDPQLVRHLVGAHHGFGRALTPLWSDPEPPTVAEWSGQALGQGNPLDWALLDSGWIEQFADLNHRYGPWGLALLEAILRRAAKDLLGPVTAPISR